MVANSQPRKKDWLLTQEEFDKLLEWLDADRNLAGERYERIRQRLTTFLTVGKCVFPLDQTDETINRVARTIAEKGEIQGCKPETFFFSVAKYVLKEDYRRPQREAAPFEGLQAGQQPFLDPEQERRQREDSQQKELYYECFKQCIQSLPQEQRAVIIQYYEGEKGGKLENRKGLARRLGINPKALDNRALRLRLKLKVCIESCIEA